jgi:hypothetical protein
MPIPWVKLCGFLRSFRWDGFGEDGRATGLYPWSWVTLETKPSMHKFVSQDRASEQPVESQTSTQTVSNWTGGLFDNAEEFIILFLNSTLEMKVHSSIYRQAWRKTSTWEAHRGQGWQSLHSDELVSDLLFACASLYTIKRACPLNYRTPNVQSYKTEPKQSQSCAKKISTAHHIKNNCITIYLKLCSVERCKRAKTSISWNILRGYKIWVIAFQLEIWINKLHTKSWHELLHAFKLDRN